MEDKKVKHYPKDTLALKEADKKSQDKKFCASIMCMDGRIQEPLNLYLKAQYQVDYVDTITEPGPCKILADQHDEQLVKSILSRVEISVIRHGAMLVAVSGHHDCAGNPTEDRVQKEQIAFAVKHLRKLYPDIEIVGLWVDENWQVCCLDIEGESN